MFTTDFFKYVYIKLTQYGEANQN